MSQYVLRRILMALPLMLAIATLVFLSRTIPGDPGRVMLGLNSQDIVCGKAVTTSLAIAWVKEQPGVAAPIIGPRTENQLDYALAVADLKIYQDLASALDEIVPPGSAVANFHNNSGWMKMKVS